MPVNSRSRANPRRASRVIWTSSGRVSVGPDRPTSRADRDKRPERHRRRDCNRVRDALEAPSRRGRLALLVAGEAAVAQTRVFVALDAEGIAGADRFGWRGADESQSARGQQCENEVTHQDLPSAAAVFHRFPWTPLTQAAAAGLRQLTFDEAGIADAQPTESAGSAFSLILGDGGRSVCGNEAGMGWKITPMGRMLARWPRKRSTVARRQTSPW